MEAAFDKILVAIDGSVQSKTAQEMAIFISRLFKSQVTLMHVVLNELPALEGELYSPREDTVPLNQATYQFPRAISLPRPKENVLPSGIIVELIERYRESGQTILNESVSLFAAGGITAVQKIVESRDISEAIVAEAEVGNYNLVIMGNSGDEENGSDLHLGSVAKKVSARAKISVLIVRQKREVKKILIPVDGSIKDEKALQKAEVLAKAANADIIVLHVLETSLLKFKPEIDEVGRQILKRASEMLETAPSATRLSSGDPAHSIIKTAGEVDADLIVMNRGGLGTLKGLFLGSVSDHVLHHATTSVLLAK